MRTYLALRENNFSLNEFSIVPIRHKDRFEVMKWRNEQVYHLRQLKQITYEEQENYFNDIINPLFEKKEPDQILFSYLEQGECIGYGGLVHINWIDKNAEISFVINTNLEVLDFQKHWEIFLNLIEQVAFADLMFHKITTYAYDLRPKLYPVLNKLGFKKEATLVKNYLFDSKYVDVVIHSKFNSLIV